ncbi:MAG: LysM domain-containing protein [bacterium]|nr:LysM domain-containing protein [bacterium]
MQNYTINSGDNLWKIAKAQYGDKISTNKEIKQVVDKLVDVNKIKNPNLIYAGAGLELPSYESIFGIEEVEIQENDGPSYDDLNKWIEDGYNKLTEGKGSEIEMYDYVQTDVSYKDAAFKEPWMEGVQNIAKSNMKASDADKDGSINYGEYVEQEVSQYNEMFPDDAFEYDKETGEITNNDDMNEFMKANFAALDYDGSGKIEQSELTAYYAAIDASDSSDGSVDGKIQFGTVVNTDLTGEIFQTRFKGAMKLFGQN